MTLKVQVLTDEFEPDIPKGSNVVIDPDLIPKIGDLVLFELRHLDEVGQGLAVFEGSRGRSEHGRFCKRGDPNEQFSLGCGLAYTRMDVDRGLVRILGTASEVRVRYH